MEDEGVVQELAAEIGFRGDWKVLEAKARAHELERKLENTFREFQESNWRL